MGNAEGGDLQQGLGTGLETSTVVLLLLVAELQCIVGFLSSQVTSVRVGGDSGLLGNWKKSREVRCLGGGWGKKRGPKVREWAGHPGER